MKNKKENNAYILGTERAELKRLGLQHQIWASEAHKGWKIAEFGKGQTLLDLGCGPGFTTKELAFIAGEEGKVIGVDRSKLYIDYLNATNNIHQLNIETHNCDFEDLELANESLDGVFDRWALAWPADPMLIIEKIVKAMRPGAAFVAHEYFDWSLFQTEPQLPALKKGIATILKSFKDSEGDIDIGRRLPKMFEMAGLEVISIRTMSKMSTPDELNWQWPYSFLSIYMPKLIDAGLLSEKEVEDALDDLEELEYTMGAMIMCPHMMEVVAIKP